MSNRITAAQNKEAVESALQYQLYFLKEEKLLLDQKLQFNSQIEINIYGKEDDKFIYLSAGLNNKTPYNAEMKLEKESLKIIEKKIYRSE
ncbi:MAG: hypothetical protein ACOCXL_02480 [Halanaerobium sp.]